MLHAREISMQFDGEDVFKDINLSLDSSAQKKVALVGRNGSGKSTLLNILVQKHKPTSGILEISDEIIGYLPQEIDLGEFELVGEFLENKITETWEEYKIETALRAVGLDLEYFYKTISHLSGGENVRVALAGLLMDEPTILLFDEPTNNLDSIGVDWLIKFISDFSGSVLVVSHDRHLINSIANEIWEIDPGTLNIKVYGGNYEKFLEEKERAYQNILSNFNLIDREIKRIQAWLKANEMHPKYRFSTYVMNQKGKLKKLQDKKTEKPVAVPQINVKTSNVPKRGRVLKVDIKQKRFNKKTIINNLEFTIHKSERLLVSGPNGSGKSTLLKIISGEDTKFDGIIELGTNVTIGYLKQFSDIDTNMAILEAFEKRTGIHEPQSRRVLAQYGFGFDMVFNKVSNLSLGQIKRLDLAIILAKNPTILILDEPTNHLDLYTREELESFILKQKIPMIIVSHDRYFVKKLGIDKVVSMQDNRTE